MSLTVTGILLAGKGTFCPLRVKGSHAAVKLQRPLYTRTAEAPVSPDLFAFVP
jgi:hypothetical protein